MKELPYFRFTCQEWNSGDISLENDSIKGLFIDICAYYWTQNCTTLHQKVIRKFPRKTQKITKLVESGIIKLNGDYIKIKFLDDQLAEITQKSKILSVAGKKGVETRERNKQATHKPPLSIKDKDKDKDKIIKGAKKFTPPSTKEISQYCFERNNKIDPNKFFDYYESQGWKVGKNKMKDWKACIRTWEKNNFEKKTGYKTNAEIQGDLVDEFLNKGKDNEEYGLARRQITEIRRGNNQDVPQLQSPDSEEYDPSEGGPFE